jgi:transcriptional regulator
MHPAPAFHETDQQTLLDELARHPFCLIAASIDGRPIVAHAPVIADPKGEGVELRFHLSARHALAPHIATGFDAVAVSLGPEAYVSPDWYGTADQVPTWNYITVEAEGSVAAMGSDDTATLLDDLSTLMETPLAPKAPWTRTKMSPGRFEAMLRGIVGARMSVRRLEGTFKLSQNKSEAEVAGVLVALDGHPVADRMRRLRAMG